MRLLRLLHVSSHIILAARRRRPGCALFFSWHGFWHLVVVHGRDMYEAGGVSATTADEVSGCRLIHSRRARPRPRPRRRRRL